MKGDRTTKRFGIETNKTVRRNDTGKWGDWKTSNFMT